MHPSKQWLPSGYKLSLRHLAACPLPSVARLQTQRRWAQVHDVRFLVTRRPPQAVLDKYREKLNQKAKQEGHGSIDDLKSAYADRIDAQRKKDAVEFPIPTIPQAPTTPVSQPNRGPIPSQQTPNAASAPPSARGKAGIQSLDEIVDVGKIRELPEKELTAVWRLRHANSPQKLCAVMPAASYKSMEAMAQKSPQFVLPVPHETQGAEIHFLQWTFDAASKTSTVLFTRLAEFKSRGEFAQPHTTVTHHLDLAEDKGLVLMQGQTMEDGGVCPEQAKWLVLCLQRFYGAWESREAEVDGSRKERANEGRKLVEWFGSGDSRFSVEKLLEEAERIG
ncbi:atp11 [Metarhizium album ARSEF 1941]|uniref:Atp11 n=1 Tax=Metarhizium album (strain ARSEF 1941) TaxID=1081103 RepID=A0A0B2WWN6_METAS|nr:atp11 [Metarhizium album ARSEF 1941]KHO00637.1 atp11 [Metarhizium album ARSEF 1941]